MLVWNKDFDSISLYKKREITAKFKRTESYEDFEIIQIFRKKLQQIDAYLCWHNKIKGSQIECDSGWLCMFRGEND